MITERRSSTWTPGLSQGERETLFAIAMDSLVYAVGAMHAAFDYAGYVLTPSLQTDRATFVTLHKASQLRGCIGSLTPDWPLCRSVHRHAVAAALEDPRYLLSARRNCLG